MNSKPPEAAPEEHFVPLLAAEAAERRGMILSRPPIELTGLRGLSIATVTPDYFADFRKRIGTKRRASPPPRVEALA